MSTILTPGIPAPDFQLNETPDQKLSLKDLRGKNVVLAFYPADWSPVCGDQMALYNEIFTDFEDRDAELLGISVDGAWCHAAFVKNRGLRFKLLADFEPKGAVAKAYGVYREGDGFTERALFIIDRGGVIRWSYCSPIGVNPGADGILDALDALNDQENYTSSLRIPVGPEDHSVGREDAPLTLVEYGDYQCPHCAAARSVVKAVQEQFGDILRFVFRNFPLTQIHSEAESAAETAEFAASQGKFWQMHEQLFDNQKNLGEPLYEKLSSSLGMDVAGLHKALHEKTYAPHVREDFSGGVRSGVNGTPTFFINGQRYDGPVDASNMIGEMNAVLAPG